MKRNRPDHGPKYPEIEVQLSDEDGNAMLIIGRVTRAMRTARIPQPEIDAFRKEAMADDYDHLLQTVMRWVEVL